MFYDNPFNIPVELLTKFAYEDDISILVGENGSGKSSMLNEIGRHFLASGASKVIAIANTIHDKFNLRGDRYEALKASTGKSIVKKTLKSALRMLMKEPDKRFNDLARTLEYVGFDPVIGLKLVGLNQHFDRALFPSDAIGPKHEELYQLFNMYRNETRYDDGIFRVSLYQSNFYDLHRTSLINVVQYEKELKSAKVIRDIEVYLVKEGRYILANQGSSGELTQITSLIYLMTTIRSNAVVLIDEPENSLHPKWQSEYVKFLAELFYRYQPKIIIATHSPLIVNSAELTAPWVKIFKGAKGTFSLTKNDVHNVEEVYQNFFDVTTPENRFLSQHVAKQMNLLATKEIHLGEFERIIGALRDNSYDEKQQDVLLGVLEMGRKIVANT